MEKKMETTIIDWRYIGIMEYKMETGVPIQDLIGIVLSIAQARLHNRHYSGK